MGTSEAMEKGAKPRSRPGTALRSARIRRNPCPPAGLDAPDIEIVFEGLTAGAAVRIYDEEGRLASVLACRDGDGRLRWDGRRGDGREAASGRYFAIISGPGEGSVLRRFSLLR